jgi:hypothetical protein
VHQAGAAFPDPAKPPFWLIKSLAPAEHFDSGGKQGSGNAFVLISCNRFSFELKGNFLASLEFKDRMIFYAQIAVHTLLLNVLSRLIRQGAEERVSGQWGTVEIGDVAGCMVDLLRGPLKRACERPAPRTVIFFIALCLSFIFRLKFTLRACDECLLKHI